MSADVYVRTTVSLREDLYQQLRNQYGNLSAGINEILSTRFKKDHSMFGTLKVPRKELRRDLREHTDRLE